VAATDDEVRAILAQLGKSLAKSGKVWRELERRSPQLRGRIRPKKVDVAALRASIRKARLETEVEKRVAAASERMLRLAEVKKITGLGRTTIWELEQRGAFPMHQKLTGKTGRAVGWRAADIARWYAERKARREE
jgi:prophage regulatory protein